MVAMHHKAIIDYLFLINVVYQLFYSGVCKIDEGISYTKIYVYV